MTRCLNFTVAWGCGWFVAVPGDGDAAGELWGVHSVTRRMTRLGSRQMTWLRAVIARGGDWYDGCGLVDINSVNSVRLCESLVRRKMMSRRTARQYVVTAEGRRVVADPKHPLRSL